MKRTNLIFTASILLFGTILASCQKSETTDPAIDSAQDDDQVNALYDNVQTEADDVIATTSATKSSAQLTADYAVLAGSGTRTVVKTFSGDTTIRTITFVNFVNGNSLNGHVKNGTMVVKIVGGPLQDQYVRLITLQNFTIDGIKIEGTTQIIKTSQYSYTKVLTGGKITFADNKTYTREFTHILTWTYGYDTPLDIWDDVYSVEGVATGVNRNGYAYTHTIINPLVIKNDCRWIVEGTIQIVVNDKTAVLDYGMGDCDNMATLTINGKSYDIKIRTKM